MWSEIKVWLPAFWARPLNRLGEYEIDEVSGSNPLPPRGLSRRALKRYWRGLLRYHALMRVRRNRACSDKCDEGSHSAWRYEMKIEIKLYESVVALLHGIIAPDAAFLCDRGCRHVKSGMTPEQLKRFLDSMDVHIALAKKRLAALSWQHPCWNDLENEIYEVQRCRDDIWEAWECEGSRRNGQATAMAATVQP